jgi:hypothetical protein
LSAGVLRFAVSSFDRVFDIDPKVEVVTLPVLIRGLLRFELKTKLVKKIETDLARTEAAWVSWQAGEYRAGKFYSALQRADKEAARSGTDRASAVSAAMDQLLKTAKGYAKSDLRLWAPTLYRTGGRRTKADVLHLSCLVLDYDGGFPMEEAQRHWSRWLHVLHTTWSHTPGQHKYRVVLPLAGPVPARDWRPVYHWAEDRVGGVVDLTMKGEAATFALPVTPHRVSRVHDGELLNPVREGLIQGLAERPAPRPTPDGAYFAPEGVAGHEYITDTPFELDQEGAWEAGPVTLEGDDWDLDDAFDLF